jgi:class 3 adenylate cyclase
MMTQTATILVAEDTPSTLRLVHDILTLHGYRVIEARDGLEALEQIQHNDPDLLILDINMPRMDGYEVCRRLKSDPRTAHIPVLILSAMEGVKDRIRGLSLGAEDYVIKPFKPDELAARVAARLRAKREVDALRSAEEYVRATFQRYVAPAVVSRLLSDPSTVSLGGTRRDVSVLFADISGFTHLSEVLEPEQTMRVLNDFLTLAGRAVLEQEGTLDKFSGDAVMALFNAPLSQQDHAYRAVIAALNIRERLAAYRCSATPDQRLKLKIGISSGDAVVGNTGMPDLMNYTAIGDTVTVAKRLEEQAQPDQILCSAHTYQTVRDIVEVHPLGPVHVKGRAAPVQVYDLLGRRARG